MVNTVRVRVMVRARVMVRVIFRVCCHMCCLRIVCCCRIVREPYNLQEYLKSSSVSNKARSYYK